MSSKQRKSSRSTTAIKSEIQQLRQKEYEEKSENLRLGNELLDLERIVLEAESLKLELEAKKATLLSQMKT